MKRFVPALLIALVAVAVVGGFALSHLRSGMRLSTSLPNAIGLEEGLPVQVKGFDVGRITKLEPRGGQALIEMRIDKLREPLHEGTTAGVKWASVLGHRLLELTPGPVSNPVLRDGAVISAGSDQVLVEELLEALDPATRTHLQGMLQQLDGTLKGSQPDFNRTLSAAGPSVRALGAVLNGLGQDGQSIKTLLENVHKVSEVLAARKSGISSTVLDLNRMTSAAAGHQRELSDGLKELPSTLTTVRSALDKVPAATDSTVPLLKDLRPVAHRLPSVAGNLKDVLRELRPALHDLPPVLNGADRVLHRGPKFFDVATNTLDQLGKTVRPEYAGNAVRFLRPYSPEIAGFFSTWGSSFTAYDSSGTFARVVLVASPNSMSAQPDVGFPGYWPERAVAPGINGNQPWTSANAWDTDGRGHPWLKGSTSGASANGSTPR